MVDHMGPCCLCGKAPGSVVVMLDFTAPVKGTGWGCVLCELPPDGAVAVLCEACAVRHPETSPDIVCFGYPSTGGGRIHVDAYPHKPFRHDPSCHPETPRRV